MEKIERMREYLNKFVIWDVTGFSYSDPKINANLRDFDDSHNLTFSNNCQ